MHPLTWILIQSGLAAAALHVFRWHVLPQGYRGSPSRDAGLAVHGTATPLILDVWAPLAIVLPLLVTVLWTGYSVRGAGWPALGGPVTLGLLALGAASIVGQDRDASTELAQAPLPYSAFIVAIISGAVLLLLGAAHVMHILVGQVAFALAAVVLWANTPDMPRPDNAEDDQPQVWMGMVLVVICAFLMGVSAAFIEASLRWLSASIMLLYGGIALLLTAMYAGPAACMRVGTWAAAVGVLLALGGLSIMQMLPQAVRLIMGGEAEDVRRIAYGFGAYAFEAAMLLVLPLFMLAIWNLPRGGRTLAGVVAIAVAAALTVWRLMSM